MAEGQIAFCTEHGLADFLADGTFLRGWAMTQQGCNDVGIAQIEECIASGRVTGLKMVRPYYLCMLADVCVKVGRFDDGLGALTEALTIADENEDRYCEPETYRLKGELLLRQADTNAAEAQSCFQRAVEIARKQSAKAWELRATMSLARMLAKQGRREEARAMLAEIYNWFTEGFDTTDLKDAKALLDELTG
jgi:predicted ATPase